jgi:group I intron endonuclease
MIYELIKSSSHIYRAILAQGLNNFSLSILEYCELDKCIERENYYFQLLSPKYNILTVAGSSKGFTHSPETRKKMSDSQIRIKNKGRFKKGMDHPKFGKTHSLEIIEKMSVAKQGAKNPMYGVPKPEGAGKSSVKLQVFDKETNETTIYSSISEAARVLNIEPRRIFMYFSRNQIKPYKNRYVFTKIDL